ncbi:hypothetical protein CEN45_13060 [Fischerella thermalis CCMEE 5198]|jgi:TRAP-type uncharacterized transport system substrate-binding protein|nr:hypothetical protein CI594_00940 [Fischerella thermalis CCMEE 5196]PMB22075.1 hypothetical protein CEN45_13060 [Fischerella thermalis CCMEE 5198]
MPLAELDTVAVDRLLVASENIDNNVIREMTRIIFENRQEISILEQVASDLIGENISQESYRTFVEAYKTTRDVIERK